jgi:hypothetical protein
VTQTLGPGGSPSAGSIRGTKAFLSYNATNSNALPATTATQILASNPGRKSAVIQNLGAVDVTLGKDSTVSASSGFRLPGGLSPPAAITDASSGDAWWAFAAATGSDVRVVEVS